MNELLRHWDHIFVLVTPLSMTVSIIAGMGLGFVQAHLLRPAIQIKTVTFYATLLLVFWYVPLTVTRMADPATYDSGLRTIGVMAQAVLFVSSMAIAVALYRRRR